MSEKSPEEIVWHRETINSAVEDVLRALHGLAIVERAYLAGGTGLALQLGHRRSVDLDFFLEQPFDEENLLQSFQSMPDVTVLSRAPQTLHLTIQGVKVSFLGYHYPLLLPPARFEETLVGNSRDIACRKITALSSRGTKRDFIDLYTACQRYSLREIFGFFARKYARTKYSRLHLLKSLTYFADAEKDPMPHMLIPLEWNSVKRFFEREAQRLR